MKRLLKNIINLILIVVTLYFKKHLISATLILWVISDIVFKNATITFNVIEITTNDKNLSNFGNTRIKDIFYNLLTITLMFLNPLIAKLIFGGTIILTIILLILDFICYFILNKMCTKEEQKEILKTLNKK